MIPSIALRQIECCATAPRPITVRTPSPPRFGGGTTFSALFNRTDTEVTEFNPDVLNAERVRRLQEAIPATRWKLTVDRDLGRWSLLGRLS